MGSNVVIMPITNIEVAPLNVQMVIHMKSA